MNEKTKLILIRHGESLGNAAGLMLGHTDLALSELGERQAEVTAKELACEKIDVIYSSDLLRAYYTAKPHADLRGMEVVKREDLREVCLGEWENKTVPQVVEKWGDMFEKGWRAQFGLFAFPEGESVKEAIERALSAIKSICKENSGKTVLIVSHGAILRGLWAVFNGVVMKDIVGKIDFPSNASYSIAYFDGDNFIPVEYSHDSHLEEVGITRVKT